MVDAAGRASTDSPWRVVNADSGAVVLEIPEDAGTPSAALFSPDGRTLVVSHDKSGLVLWNLASGTRMGAIPLAVGAYAFSPNGTQLLAGGPGHSLNVLEYPSGRRRHVIQSTGEAPTVAAFRTDGSAVAAGYEDGTIRLWKLDGPALLGTLSRHAGRVTAIGFSPDGTRVASGGADGRVRIWDVAAIRLVAAVSAGDSTDDVMAVAYSPDGRYIWAASDLPIRGATVRVWNASRLGPYVDLAADFARSQVRKIRR